MPAPKPFTVLLTGASGVVGTALLDRLRDVDIVCLIHRSDVSGARVSTVRGDVSHPRLGLTEQTYDELTARVDAVIHCAAVTDFNRTDGSLAATNVAGTAAMIEFAAAAGAVLYHVSTAFVNTRAGGERGRTALGYASSKSAAEDLVRAAGIDHVILRPSVVIGDSATGAIAAFQGLHQVVAGVFSGMVPMIPFDAAWPIDFLPADVVADAIATVVERGQTSGEYWITAGAQALSLAQGMAVCVDMARDYGLTVDAPRFVPPELFDRLIGPVFLDVLPERLRRTVLRMLEFFATYLQSGATLPSSADELAVLGAASRPDQRDALRASIGFWAEAKGYAIAAAETPRAA